MSELKYSVKIIGNHFEGKGTIATWVPQSMYCSCDVNFTLIVIKRAQETPIYATVWEYCITEWICDAGENKVLVMKRIQLEMHLLGPNRGMLMLLTKRSAVGTGKT